MNNQFTALSIEELIKEFKSPTTINMRVKSKLIKVNNSHSRHLTKTEVRQIFPKIFHSMILSDVRHLVIAFAVIEPGIRRKMEDLLEYEWESNNKVYRMRIHRDVADFRKWHLYIYNVEEEYTEKPLENITDIKDFLKMKNKPNKEDVAKYIVSTWPNITQLSLDTAVNRVLKSWKEARS